MDRVSAQARLTVFLTKYRYALIVVLLGVILMCLPKLHSDNHQSGQEMIVQTGDIEDLEDRLARILGQIQGAGRVEVLLTEAAGALTHYQTDTDQRSADDRRQDTVIVTNADRSQTGLIRRIDPPRYQGAVVVCQGADSASVRLAIVQAVASVTGLGADQIAVLKMN